MADIIGKIRIRREGKIHLASLTRKGDLLLEDGRVLTVSPGSMRQFREKMIPAEKKEVKEKKGKDTASARHSAGISDAFFKVLVLTILSVLLVLLMPKSSKAAGNGTIRVVRAGCDISKGTRITRDMLEGIEMPVEKYRLIASGIYLTREGSTVSDALILSEDRDDIIGGYAARNIESGEPLTASCITFRAPSSGSGFVQVEVNGRTMDIPLDPGLLSDGVDTRVDILAVFSEDGNEGSRRALLASFTLRDRQLIDIYTQAGEGIMRGLEDARQD